MAQIWTNPLFLHGHIHDLELVRRLANTPCELSPHRVESTKINMSKSGGYPRIPGLMRLPPKDSQRYCNVAKAQSCKLTVRFCDAIQRRVWRLTRARDADEATLPAPWSLMMAVTLRPLDRTTPRTRAELQAESTGLSDHALARRYGITAPTVLQAGLDN